GSGIIVSGGSFANTGQVSSGGSQPAVIRSLQVTQSCEGRIEAIAPGATVRLAGTDLSGGTIATSNGGVIRVEELSRFDDVQMSGQFDVFRGTQLTLASGVVFQGTMRINPGNGSEATSLAWDPEHPPALSGVVALEGTPERAWISSSGAAEMPLTIPADLRVEGVGLIDAPSLIEGEIAPGLASELGTLSANGVMQFAPDASLRISVDAVGADVLVSASQVELAGTLVVEPLGMDMLPDGYWTHQIVFAPSITGGFDTIEALGIADGRAIRVKHAGPILSIVHTCLTDFDLDGEQDFFDVSAFIDAYIACDPGADLTGDGQMDFFDISTFLAAYQGGCDL
ncbi:MAG: GC-type dockerin domain-anchored protein, partial [Phycisphaerales bacterium]